MTREEAQKILAEYVKACREDDMLTLEQFVYEEVIEAMSMGAEALSVCPVYSNLEEAANEYEKKHTYQRYDGGGFTPEYDATLAEAVIFGAKWQREQDEKDLSEKIAAAYQLGLADKEKQMMKEAVEGRVFMSFAPGHNQMVMADVDLPTNTKVRVIVLPKED